MNSDTKTHTVIKNGDPKAKWWSGREVTCPTCQQVIKLGPDAFLAIEFAGMPHPGEIRWGCAHCHTLITIQK